MKEISVEFVMSIKNKEMFLPLSHAEIVIRDADTVEGSIFKEERGILNKEGKFTPTFEIPSNFIVEIISKFKSPSGKSEFSIRGRAAKGQESKEHIAKFKNTYKCQIGINESNDSEITATANPWSVFQATAEYVSAVEDKLKLYMNYGIIYSYSDGPASYFHTSVLIDDGQTFIHERDHLYWASIGHEVSHALDKKYKILRFTPDATQHSSIENQYDYMGSKIKKKNDSMSIAFSEGFATWLSVTLLKESINYQRINVVMTSMPFQDNLVVSVQAGTPTTRNFEGRGVIYGEDSEWAAAQLLWNITNQKGGELKRINQSKKTNEVDITLQDLFYKVLLTETENEEGKKVLQGYNLQNVNHFYEKLFEYYVSQDEENPKSTNLDLEDIKPEEFERISELGYLFAEFGMAPNPYYKQEDNVLGWSQHKTGSLPEQDNFDIYIFEKNTGKLRFQKKSVTIESKKDKDKDKDSGKQHTSYRYELDFKSIMGKNPREMFALIVARSTKGAMDSNNEIGQYFSSIAGLNLVLKHSWITRAVEIGTVPRDSILISPDTNNITLRQPGDELGPGGVFHLFVDDKSVIRGYYEGWEKNIGEVPQFEVIVLLHDGSTQRLVFGTPIQHLATATPKDEIYKYDTE